MTTKKVSWIGIMTSFAWAVFLLLILIYIFTDFVWFKTHIDTILNVSSTFLALAIIIDYLSQEK